MKKLLSVAICVSILVEAGQQATVDWVADQTIIENLEIIQKPTAS